MNISLQLIQRYKTVLSSYRFIIVQHLLQDSYAFIKNLNANGVEVYSVLYKDYSVNVSLLNKLKECNINIMSADKDINSLCSSIIDEAVKEVCADGKKIIILDLGGVFSEISNRYDPFIQCIVEDTHYGHWRYKNKKHSFSIYSVAESKLKEIEAIAVGKSIIVALYESLLSLGVSLFGKKALVIGYGMIGKNIAQSLKDFGVTVYINDVHEHKLLSSLFQGYEIVSDFNRMASQFDIIIGATGKQSITCEKLRMLKGGGFICSASSNNVEIDMSYLSINSSIDKINTMLTTYLIDGKAINVLYDGFPINFTIQSVPDEVIDLLFSEMIFCVIDSINSSYDNTYDIRFAPEKMIDHIAGLWMNGVLNENKIPGY